MAKAYDIVIIGAGPGGLSAAANAAHHKLSYILLEKGEIINTIHEYQLGKHVMAEPVKLPLRSHLKFGPGTREEILESWTQLVKETPINVRQRAQVTEVERTDTGFSVFYGDEAITCQSVILAIGTAGAPRKLGTPGEDHPHISYRLGDPEEFTEQDILVVGAGDAAIENALALAETNRVSIINRKGEFARAKSANASLIAEAISSAKVRCYYNSTLAHIEPGQTVINHPEGEVSVNCTHLIARLGGVPPRKFLESCGVEFPSSNPNAVPRVSHRYESNVKGLYLIGSLIGYPLIKQALNQGYEVIEHIMGNDIEPSDQALIEEKLQHLPGSVNENMKMIRMHLSLFQGLSDPQFRELIVESEVHIKKADDLVFERNDYSDTFFSIISGSVKINLPNNQFVELGGNDFFGEMGLLSGRRRSATIHMKEPGLLLETPRKLMLKLISSVTSVQRALDEVFILRALQTDIFPDVHVKFLRRLVTKAQLVTYKKGDVIFREGDVGNALHVIRKGSVKISHLIKNTNVTQTYLSAGNYFGEMALLSPDPMQRTATVTAAVACETIVIGKFHFLEFLKDNPSAAQKISKTIEERRVDNVASRMKPSSGEFLDFMLEKGLSDADNVLLIDSDFCIGCDNCEKACAATHNGFSRLDRKGGESFASIQVPASCRHCENPLCMTDCPPDALVRQADGEIIIKDSCIGCGNCRKNCPYDVIQMVGEFPKKEKFSLSAFFVKPFSLFTFSVKPEVEEEKPKKAVKCDLCIMLDGGPACVRSCPTGAAMRVNSAKMLELTAQKRGFYYRRYTDIK